MKKLPIYIAYALLIFTAHYAPLIAGGIALLHILVWTQTWGKESKEDYQKNNLSILGDVIGYSLVLTSFAWGWIRHEAHPPSHAQFVYPLTGLLLLASIAMDFTYRFTRKTA